MTKQTYKQLNRAMAELMGWTVRHNECLGYFKLVRPDGSDFIVMTSENWYYGERETEEEAWLDVPHFNGGEGKMFAVLQWDHDAPIDAIPMVIAENVTAEQADVIVRMNPNQYCREAITTEDLADRRKVNEEVNAHDHHKK